MSQIGVIIEGRPLIHAELSDRVRDVARKMTTANVGAVAVLDGGRLVGVFSERDVMMFANKMHVHPGIVVGQIHNRTKKYELFRRYQVRVREYLMPTAMVDGWGHVAPVSI